MCLTFLLVAACNKCLGVADMKADSQLLVNSMENQCTCSMQEVHSQDVMVKTKEMKEIENGEVDDISNASNGTSSKRKNPYVSSEAENPTHKKVKK